MVETLRNADDALAMCGIAGIFDLKASREVDRDALHKMTDALTHRGPDGEGHYFAPGVGIGHRRLAIIDPVGGVQPFITSGQTGILTYNGEIYNYRQLTAELRHTGINVSTNSDTEVLAEGVAQFGVDFLQKLRGVFAFCFFDIRSNTLFLARDRLGEKPLYYAESQDGFLLFASEIRSLAASGLLSTELDATTVADYFFYGFVPDSKAIYKNVHKLPPGAFLKTTKGGKLRINNYWRLQHSSTSNNSFEQMEGELTERLDDAVHSQMISDVPLGAFLSGGLDSSSIVSAMKKRSDELVTCSIGFRENSHDETFYARKVAAEFNTNHHEEIVHTDALSLIDKIALSYGEPFADSSALPTYLLAESAKRHVSVALSGDGGDELFAGYRRHRYFLEEERIRALLPETVKRSVLGSIGAAYPKLDWAPRPLRFKTTLQMLSRDRASAYAHAVAANFPERSQRMLSEDFHRTLAFYQPQSLIEAIMTDRQEPALAAARRVDMEFWLPGRMLTKIDRASMAHGLEVRPPMLDHTFVEWAMTIPESYRLNLCGGKRILRRAMAPRLPRSITTRRKQGFAIPLDIWLRQPGGPMNALLTSRIWRHSGLFREDVVETMARTHKSGLENNSQELWSLIMFDAFLRQKDVSAKI